MKRILAAVMGTVLLLFMSACHPTKPADVDATLKDTVKIGVILSADESEGYSASHIEGINSTLEKLGLSENQVMFKFNVSSDSHCFDTATELADNGCAVIFGTSYDFEEQMFKVAQRYPDVQFCQASGKNASKTGLDNTHNYFVSLHEARYVSGVVAGMKLEHMIENEIITTSQAKVGYIGSYENAEVRSAFTAFFLGVRSVVPEAVMEVKYTGPFSAENAEKEAAKLLIDNGCVVISQHSDTKGTSSVCELRDVYFVGFNQDVNSDFALTSVKVNWEPYYTYAIQCVIEKKNVDTDWCAGYDKGTVCVAKINEKAVAQGTRERVLQTEKAIKEGTLKIFDTHTFTVDGRILTSTANLEGYDGVEYIVDGAFAESEFSSVPAFNFVVDGIKEIK